MGALHPSLPSLGLFQHPRQRREAAAVTSPRTQAGHSGREATTLREPLGLGPPRAQGVPSWLRRRDRGQLPWTC